jgi:hypothetical protein
MTSIIKVDNLQNQCGANIINENAGTITIGASGDTVTLAAGASQSGFGRSGSVNWDTTPKTTGFTAVSGNGYFCDTTSAAFTVTLPATPSAGDIVAIADYDGTAATNNITVGRNSSNINGDAADFTISKNYAAVSFVYVDATAGWRSVDTSNVADVLNPFIVATGGTITCDGDFKVHTFTGPGTFTVTNVGPGSSTVDYLVVAGGGGGGAGISAGPGGGGGAGGYRESSGAASGCYSVSPLGSGVSAIPVAAQAYPITVGSGGSGVPVTGDGSPGNNSVFSTITSTGGGGGGGASCSGTSGGSGGGACGVGSFGSGNTPPTSPSQGNNGGDGQVGCSSSGGGGGGATAVGTTGIAFVGGNGGAGATTSISGSPTAYAGGGGGGSYENNPGTVGTGGSGGGGNGGHVLCSGADVAATNGTANTGGGGGGSGGPTPAGPQMAGTAKSGGSGIVIIRYKFQ